MSSAREMTPSTLDVTEKEGAGDARSKGEDNGDGDTGLNVRGDGGGGGGRRDWMPLSSDAELEDRKCCAATCKGSVSLSVFVKVLCCNSGEPRRSRSPTSGTGLAFTDRDVSEPSRASFSNLLLSSLNAGL